MRKIRQSTEHQNVDMTPLLDVVFILLIFFIVTTRFSKETAINLASAKSSQSEPKVSHTLLVSVDAGGELMINGDRVRLGALTLRMEHLKAQQSYDRLLIRADYNVQNGLLVAIADRARAVGFDKPGVVLHRSD